MTVDSTSGSTLAVIFNDAAGPQMVVDIIERVHSFIGYETVTTKDERGSTAWLLIVRCETATPGELFEMIGNRLPDYIRARHFPPSRLAQLTSKASA